jgi:hypothetical protein
VSVVELLGLKDAVNINHINVWRATACNVLAALQAQHTLVQLVFVEGK